MRLLRANLLAEHNLSTPRTVVHPENRGREVARRRKSWGERGVAAIGERAAL